MSRFRVVIAIAVGALAFALSGGFALRRTDAAARKVVPAGFAIAAAAVTSVLVTKLAKPG